jgi:hypothetical protein
MFPCDSNQIMYGGGQGFLVSDVISLSEAPIRRQLPRVYTTRNGD